MGKIETIQKVPDVAELDKQSTGIAHLDSTGNVTQVTMGTTGRQVGRQRDPARVRKEEELWPERR